MHRFERLAPPLALAVGLALAAPACGDDAAVTAGGFDDAQIIVDFADAVVIPTYEALAARGAALEVAVDAFYDDPTDAKLALVRAAWVAARMPWEASEAFLFGPVDTHGYDPALDTWPLDKNDLNAVIAGSDGLTDSYVAALPTTQKGFHTIEFLAFGDDGAKAAAALTARERDYLRAVTREFAAVTEALATAWTDGLDGGRPYREVFVTAGQGSGAYPSLASAAQEIVSGMSAICDEVANGKIADPYDAHDPQLEESRFSGNSLLDFADNMRSVQNAYLGAVPFAGTAGRGLSAWVAAEDAALDGRIRSAITAAIAAIEAIPGPFGDAIVTPSAYPAIEAAQAAIRSVQDLLDAELLPLLLE